jgi:hypothetical protein
MSAMVQAAHLYITGHGPIEVQPSPNAEDCPLSPRELASNVMQLQAEWRSGQELLINLQIAPGFHVNANKPAEGFTATRLAIANAHAADVANVAYPSAGKLTAPFASEPIDVYTTAATIIVTFKQDMTGQPPLRMALTYQACDDQSCLPPITKEFEVRIQ